MNLEEYFKNQKLKMPEQDKLVVFDDIKTQISNKSIFTKVSFYAKVSVYSLFLLFIFFWLFPANNSKNRSSLQISRNINTVEAWYIWKIITFTWDFDILDNWKKLDTNIIRKWNVLVLNKKTNIILWINSWIKLYLLWPAKVRFSTYKNDEWKDIYVINMIDGDYLSVKSNSAKDKIVIKSKFLNIQSNDKLIDIKYTKDKKAVILENNGWNILINNNNNKFISLNKKEKLFVMNSEKVLYIKDIFSDNYKKYQLTNSWNIKTVLSSNQIYRLSNILDRKQVILSIWKYVLWKLNKDDRWIKSWKTETIKIIKNVYNLFNIDLPLSIKNKEILLLSSDEVQFMMDNLISNIDKKYVIPLEYTNRLKVMLAYVVIMNNVDIKNKKIPNLSYLVNYLKLDKKYKKMLLKF